MESKPTENAPSKEEKTQEPGPEGGEKPLTPEQEVEALRKKLRDVELCCALDLLQFEQDWNKDGRNGSHLYEDLSNFMVSTCENRITGIKRQLKELSDCVTKMRELEGLVEKDYDHLASTIRFRKC